MYDEAIEERKKWHATNTKLITEPVQRVEADVFALNCRFCGMGNDTHVDGCPSLIPSTVPPLPVPKAVNRIDQSAHLIPCLQGCGDLIDPSIIHVCKICESCYKYDCVCKNTEIPEQEKWEQFRGSEGVKYDDRKPRYDLIPVFALDQLAEVYRVGAEKYADRNWEKGMRWGRIFAALMRHLLVYWSGQEFDQETGLRHLAQAAWGCFALLEYGHRSSGTDDRPKHGRIERSNRSDSGGSEQHGSGSG